MDRPRHPLVIRPWKTRQTQQKNWSVTPPKAGEAQQGSKEPKAYSQEKESRKHRKKPS